MQVNNRMNMQFVNALVILSPTSGLQPHKFDRHKQTGEMK
jgi:hypothetical protein